MQKIYFYLLAIILYSLPYCLQAQTVSEYCIPLSVTIENGNEIRLTWPLQTNVQELVLFRKLKTESSWSGSVSLPVSAVEFTDNSVSVGVYYEYQLRKKFTNSANTVNQIGLGTISSGIQVPLEDQRGKLILVVDTTAVAGLNAELRRLTFDLYGDGWRVIRLNVDRADAVTSIKTKIKAIFDADPSNVKMVFLLGRVPIPYSGEIAPDGHVPDHLGAWPTDTYYGDMDGIWTDVNVNNTGASRNENDNIPGDGKFDQNEIPSDLELMIGRVDLSRMPAFSQTETQLIKRYLDKNHDFRHTIIAPQRRGLIDDNFGFFGGGEIASSSGRRSFSSFFGQSNVFSLDYFTELNVNSYSCAYGNGAGSYTSSSGIGNTNQFRDNQPKAVFNFIFGSYFGDWDSDNNFLRAPLASAGWGLTNIWAGRPYAIFHHMGLGDPAGYSGRLTANSANGTTYQMSYYAGIARGVQVNLMGDPSLRLHPVIPPSNLIATLINNDSDVKLDWNASTDVDLVGYHVYRFDTVNNIYLRLTPTPINFLTYDDLNPFLGYTNTYMVRAIKLDSVNSGSYYNGSQGMFISIYVPIPVCATVRTAHTNVSCSGGNDGTIDLIVDGNINGNATYNWTKNNMPYGGNTQDLSNLSIGRYCVTFTDELNCTDTKCVILTEPLPLTTVGIPTNVQCFGQNNGAINLNVAGGTSGYAFEWTKDLVPFSNTEDLINLAPGNYSVTVTDQKGCTSIKSYTITQPSQIIPTISDSNNGNPICAGDCVTLTASGAVNYYWTPGNLSGSVVSVCPSVNTTYTLVASNINGCSDSITYSVDVLPNCNSVGGNLSANQTVCDGSPALPLTLNGYNGDIIRWEQSSDNFITVATINNTLSEYSPGILTQKKCYRAVVQFGNFAPTYSDTVCINVDQQAIGGTLSPFQTICRNSASVLTLTGNFGNVVRWEKSINSNFSPLTIINSTSSTINSGPVSESIVYYRAVIKNGVCPEIFSSITNIVTDNQSNPGVLSSDQTICSGDSTNINLTGQTGNIIRWEKSTNCASFSPNTIISNTTNSYSTGALIATTCYRAIIRNGVCPEVYSNIVTITVSSPASGGIVSSSATICEGSSPPTLLLTGYQGQIVRWEKSINNFITVQTIANFTQIYLPGILTNSTCFRAIVNNGCGEVSSQPACITVEPIPVAGTLASDRTICEGTNTTISLSGNSANIIRWEKSDNSNFTPLTIINSTLNNYTLTNVNQTTWVRAVVGSQYCPEVLSNIIKIETTPPTIPGDLSADMTFCEGDNFGTLILSNYQGVILNWEKSNNNFATYETIDNTTDFYDFSNLTQTTYYRVSVKNGVCQSLVSNFVKVTILPAALGGQLTSDQTVCNNLNAGYLNLINYVGTIQYWEMSSDDFITFTVIPNNSPTLNYSALTQTTKYRVMVSNEPCGSEYSSIATVTVVNSAVGGTVIANRTVCANDNTGTLILTGSSGQITHWEASTDNFNTITTLPNTTTMYIYNNIPVTTWFRAVLGGDLCGMAKSLPAKITTVNNAISGTLSANFGSSGGCAGSSGILVLSGHSGNIIRWERSTNNFLTFTPINNTQSTYNFNISSQTQFRVVLQNAPCSPVYSNIVNISGGFTLNVTALRECNNVGKIVAVAQGGTPSYTYVITPNAGVQNPAGVFSNLPPATYTITVKDKNNCAQTKTVVVPGKVTGPMILNILHQNNTSVRVDWMDISPGGNNVFYQIRYKPTSSSTWTTKNVGSNTTYTLLGLVPNTSYQVQVRVKCLPGTVYSTWSPVTNFNTPIREESVQILSNKSTINLYPNPNNGDFKLSYQSEENTKSNIRIYDLTGKLVWNQDEELISGENDIEIITDLTSGVYYLVFNTSNYRNSMKIVIE